MGPRGGPTGPLLAALSLLGALRPVNLDCPRHPAASPEKGKISGVGGGIRLTLQNLFLGASYSGRWGPFIGTHPKEPSPPRVAGRDQPRLGKVGHLGCSLPPL